MARVVSYEERVNQMYRPQDVQIQIERAKKYMEGFRAKAKKARTFDENIKFIDMGNDAEGVLRQLRMNCFELEGMLMRNGASNILISPPTEVEGRQWRVIVIDHGENTPQEEQREVIHQFADGDRWCDQELWPTYDLRDILYKGLPKGVMGLHHSYNTQINHALETGYDTLSLHLAIQEAACHSNATAHIDF